MEKEINILVVDDESNVLKLFIEFFRNLPQYKLHISSDGIDSIDVVSNTNNIDIIFMDERMPVMSGSHTAHIIHVDHPEIPIICISAFDANTLDKKTFQGFLQKPFRKEDVFEIIKTIFN